MRLNAAQPSQELTIETLIQRIKKVFEKWDNTALKIQKGVIRFASLTSLLIPLAVFLLTIQILAFPQAGTIAILLISAELAALLFALIIIICHFAPGAEEWAKARLRAEVLRREEFLLLGRVGPYLKRAAPAALEPIVEDRLSRIDNSLNSPDMFIPLRDSKTWRDELEEEGQDKTASPDKSFSDQFFEHRILDQQNWFWRKREKFIRRDWRYENIIRSALALAFMVAAMHLVTLLVGTFEANARFRVLQLVIEIAAIGLPPLGSGAAALQSLYQGRRLGRSYEFHAKELEIIKNELSALNVAWKEKTIAQENFEFKLKRIVLRTEELLANELRVWFFVMRPL